MPHRFAANPRSKATKAQSAERKRAIMDYVSEHPGCLGSDVRGALGLTVNQFKRAVQNMTGYRRVGGHGKSFGRYYTQETP